MPLGELLGLPELMGTLLLSLYWNIGAVVLMFLGKRFITVPRIGIIKFGPKRKADQRKLKIFLTINVFFGLAIFLIQMSGFFGFINLNRYALTLLMAVFIGFPFGVVAYFMDFHRLYIYAIFGSLGFFFTEILEIFMRPPFSLILTFGTIGGSILVTGIIFLIKFLREYSIPEKLS